MEKEKKKKLLAQLMSFMMMISLESCSSQETYSFETQKGERNLKDYEDYLDNQGINYKNCKIEVINNIIILKETKYIKYTVSKNETINEIVNKYEMDKKEFLKINNLSENEQLKKGQNIKIIYKTEYIFTIEELDQQSNWQYHLILPGETLSEIAELYDTTPEEIQKENNIKDINTIEQYKTLRIKKETNYTKNKKKVN